MRLTRSILASVSKAMEPEAEIFCSTALRTLLLLHDKVEKVETNKLTADPKQGYSQQVQKGMVRLKTGRYERSPTLSRFGKMQDKRKVSVASTGRELLSLAMLSPLLTHRLEENRQSRVVGSSVAKPNALDRKYLDHIEACVIESAKKRHLKMQARNVDLDPCFQLFPFVTHTPVTNAGTLANMICRLIERDVSFRRIWPQIEKMYQQNSVIRGIRVACAGRTSRKATKAKTLNARAGSTSLAVFSRDVDYATATADTRHGSIGIKTCQSASDDQEEVDEFPRQLMTSPMRFSSSPKKDASICLRCHTKVSSKEEGPCRFHPFLLEDPGPLKYTAAWLKCKNEKHRSTDIGCYSRSKHFFTSSLT